MDRLRLEVQNFGPFLVTKYINNYSYQNISIIKVVLLFSYSSMKKNQKDSVAFWNRKMALKTRIVPYLTFHFKCNQIFFMTIFKTILIDLCPYNYLPLNSATLNCLSEVTLSFKSMHFIFKVNLDPADFCPYPHCYFTRSKLKKWGLSNFAF